MKRARPRPENTAKNTAKRRPRRPGRGRDGQEQGELQTGNPGNKGGTGRPSKKVTEFWQGVIEDPDVQAAVLKSAKNPKSPAFGKIVTYATDRIMGKPRQAVTVSGKIEGTGVLAVPVPVTSEQWGKMATAQQEELLKRPPKASAAGGA